MEPDQLARQLTDELARTFDLPQGARVVELEGDGTGGITLARIDLSGARLDLDRALQTRPAAHRPPDLVIGRLEVRADPLTVEGAPLFLDGHAEEVGVALSDGPARLVTLKSGTASGHVAREDLEAAARSAARQLAKRYGVELEEFDLQLSSAQPRALTGRARVRAARRVLVANVRTTVSGHASLEAVPDQGLVLVDVGFDGQGPLAPVVSGIVSPRLERLRGRVLPLPVFPGRIVDARFEVGQVIRVEARLAG